MDPLVIVLMVIMVVLTVLLVIVGIQVIFILKEVRASLVHFNRTLSTADSMIGLVSNSLHGMGDTLVGVKSGLKVLEVFIHWLKDREPALALKRGKHSDA